MREDSFRVPPENHIEPWLPGFATVSGCDGYLANTAIHRLPGATNLSFLAAWGSIEAAQNHLAVLHSSFNGLQNAAVGHPGLVPHFSRGVIDTEAFPV